MNAWQYHGERMLQNLANSVFITNASSLLFRTPRGWCSFPCYWGLLTYYHGWFHRRIVQDPVRLNAVLVAFEKFSKLCTQIPTVTSLAAKQCAHLLHQHVFSHLAGPRLLFLAGTNNLPVIVGKQMTCKVFPLQEVQNIILTQLSICFPLKTSHQRVPTFNCYTLDLSHFHYRDSWQNCL